MDGTGTLFVVATPIGNLGDISPRALDTLRSVAGICAEDTRRSGQLLSHFGISTPLLALHEHNEDAIAARIVARLQGGESLALVSDAGTPLVSDPGYRLVIAAHEQGSAVFPLPGASAVLAALVLAGLPTDHFLFAGFLPHKGGPRETALAQVREVPGSLVFFEGPSRLQASLASMAKVLGDRPAAVTRELTKIHETCVRGTLSQLAADPALAEVKGEIVIVVGPPLPAAKAQAESADALLAEALTRLSPGEAATEVAQALGLPRKAVYARLLAMKSAAP